MADALANGCSADLPRDAVLFSTADWNHPFWTNKQRVATQLAAAGFRVLYVESLGLRRPTATGRDLARMATRVKRACGGAHQVARNIWTCSPLVLPVHGSKVVRAINDRFLLMQVLRSLCVLGMRRPLVWTYNPLTVRVACSLRPSLLLYHAVDDLSAVPGAAGATLASAESELARAADLVFTTSPALQGRLNATAVGKTHFLPNVADYEHFAQARLPGPIPADLQAIPRPRIGFVGAISPYKVDFALIRQAALRRPDVQWVLIGQVGEGQPHTDAAALNLPNIHLLGPRAYQELPAYLRGFDAAVIPCPANNYTSAMFPMKFFEYLSAGCPVVASNVPALRDFSDACVLVDTDDEFCAALDSVLAGHRPNATTADELARHFTWRWRMGEMLKLVQAAWQQRNDEGGDTRRQRNHAA